MSQNTPVTASQIYSIIARHKPAVIYISGKSSTGKSTFGRKLRDELGYYVIELEAVLLDVIKEHAFEEQATFHKVLYEPGKCREKDLFLAKTDAIISDAVRNSEYIVIEGAVANIVTLQRILQPAPDLYFLYFHPSNLDVYIRNLTKRFMQSSNTSSGGLSRQFWQLVDTQAFQTFCHTRQLSESLKNSIERYAMASQQASLTRLAEIKRVFAHVTEVYIQ